MRPWLFIALLVGCGSSGDRNPTSDSGSTADALQPTPPPDIDQVSKACISAAACLPSESISFCMDEAPLLQFYVSIYRPEQIRCLAAAGADCTRARACVGLSETPCSPPGYYCDGTVLHGCSSDGTDYVQQCSGGAWYTPETTCVVGSQPECGLATCTTPNGGNTCVGDHLQWCNGLRAVEEVDCSLAQQTCIADSNGPHCGTPGIVCSQPGKLSCDGNVLVACDSTNHATRYPSCDTLLTGGVCTPARAPCGFGSLCQSLSPASCVDADHISLCAMGLPKTYSCAKLGYSGCSNGQCVP